MSERTFDVARWLGAAQAGSREALGRLLTAYQTRLLRIASRKVDAGLRAKGEAWDLVQETFLDASRDFRRFAGGSEPELSAWLCRLLRNNLGDFRRRYRGTAKRQAASETSLGDAGILPHPGSDLPSHACSPSERMIAHEQAEALRRAVQRLPADLRQVIRLRSEEDLPFGDISRLMGRSANAVEKLWLRAVGRLREDLKAIAE